MNSVDDALTAMDVALASLTGDYVAFLDHNDILAPHALAMMADAINQHAEADIFYSDEDKLDPSGQRYDPWFKPDWNPELLKGQDYVRHLGVFRTALVGGLQGLGREAGEAGEWLGPAADGCDPEAYCACPSHPLSSPSDHRH